MTSAEEEELYRRACALVQANRSASCSRLQRQLRLGYNSTARLIERMEREGLFGSPPIMAWARGKLPPEPVGLIVSPRAS